MLTSLTRLLILLMYLPKTKPLFGKANFVIVMEMIIIFESIYILLHSYEDNSRLIEIELP